FQNPEMRLILPWICLASGLFERARAQKPSADLILQRILNDSYDARVRPSAADEKGNVVPVAVEVNIMIRSLEKVDVVSMRYDLQIMLRQFWKDPRLAYGNINPDAPPSISISDRDAIWKPDTYFQNERHTHRHGDVLIRISPDGSVKYSERLTVTLACPMHLEMFPLDVQECPLELASFGHSDKDIVYKWGSADPVLLKDGVGETLPSIHLDGLRTSEYTSRTNTGSYTILRVSFHLKRMIRHYIMQVFIPSAMLVIVSWVSFWLDRTFASARVGLGISTLLTLTVCSAALNSHLPPVNYIKALDVWIGVSLSFIFASLAEYALVCFKAEQQGRKGETYR
ncbi:hypothetical protein PMAYCL1PPCAC_00210, partial [Pristionchus mayeri]